jgi:hypothetical protein
VKTRTFLLMLLAGVLLATVAASAQILYDNGPINGDTDGWTINEGFNVNDNFTISTGNSHISGLSFGAWLFPGDILESVQVLISSEAFGGTVYFNQQVSIMQSSYCATNSYGFNICTESATFDGPNLGNGTYWLTLLNGVVNDGDPVYWDENSGVDCTSEGCPSQACEGDCEGSIPSESFTVLGTSTSTTGTVPEPASLALVGGGFFVIVETLRRRFYL